MRSQSKPGEDIQYAIEHCLYFSHPQKEEGTLSLTGWCYDPRSGDGLCIDVINNGEKAGPFTPTRERPDVCEHQEAAPARCGFQLHLPTGRKWEAGDCVSFSIGNGAEQALEVSREVVSFQDHMNDRIKALDLSDLQKSKLENLALNESERIHHVKKIASSPVYLMIDPSWDCELDCLYCNANAMRKAGFTLKMMDDETFQKIMDRFGDTLVMVHMASWGEPFLNENTTKFIRAMKAHEIHVVSNSNFNIPYTDGQIADIVSSGIDRLIASVDGATQETYARYKRKGSLERALENIRRIVARREALGLDTPRIRWQYVLFDWNQGEVDAARKMAGEIGCDEFVTREGIVFENYKPFLEDRDISFIDSMKPEIRDRMAEYYEERKANGQHFGCDYLYHQMVINADGSIHPCRYVHEPRHLFGSVHPIKILFKSKDRPHDMFNSAYYKIARGLFAKAPAEQCQGYDPCLNCWVVTDGTHRGHVPSTLDFFRVFEMITGEPFFP